jgi:hypothetical protein
MGVLRILGPGGDDRHEWDPDDPEQVRALREQFDDLVASGSLAWSTTRADREPGTATAIREFDPDADQIVVSPRMRGG